MDLDQQHGRRPSTAHDRPSRTPYGPRIRTKRKNSSDITSPGPASPLVSSSHSTADSPALDLTPLSIGASLDSLLDPSTGPMPAHPPLPSPILPLSALTARADAAVQVPCPATPSPLPFQDATSSPLPSPPIPVPAKPTTAPKTPVATFIAPPPLTPPPTVTFDSVPVPWKGLPLEAAQWTFSSSELQEVVSKAIRLSARESFVRLLPLQALEVDIVRETERLDAERAAAQARWRFEVGRRTMLLQALNSSAASSAPIGNAYTSDSGVASPVPGFICQLATSIASCDTLLSSILHSQDQQSQIALIQHQHWASALAIALRKLNRAYERQGQELKRVQARVQTLEDELEEAWREAERVAIEFDDFEQEVAESESDDPLGEVGLGLQTMDVVPQEVEAPDMPADPGEHEVEPESKPEFKQDMDETGTLGDATLNSDVAIVLGVTATGVASKATLVTSPTSPKCVDKSDAKSCRSVKSTRSRRSTRDGSSHVTRVSAARTRSRTASNASLRLPKSLRSAPPAYASPVDAPPMPALPIPSVQGQSFLDMDNLVNEQVRKAVPQKRQPEPMLTLPTTPSRVPSIWLETDGGKSTRLNGLDRTHSLQIFSSLTGRTPRKERRSNLVMSLTGSDRGSDGSPVEDSHMGISGTGASPSPGVTFEVATAMNAGTSYTKSRAGGNGNGNSNGSPTSNSSPVSLPTHALAHFRGPSVSTSTSSSRSRVAVPRPGSADARLTTAGERLPVATPRRSLVSRASSVILRRLSQATTGSRTGNKGMGMGMSSPSSPAKPRELRLSTSGRTLEGWRERDGEAEDDGEGEGEVILIGSPHTELLDNL